VVGNILFRSAHNGSQNPAVDTVAVGSTVTWTWTGTGTVSHSVQSDAAPSFASSAILSGDGRTYSVTFTTPGTYRYDCAVHGSAMTGTIVVQ
jgi:plastocyanin